jgi:hypothetical protein
MAEKHGYDPEVVVDPAFDAWQRGRHDVERLFFPGALDLLAR